MYVDIDRILEYYLIKTTEEYIKTFINAELAYIPLRNHRFIAKKIRLAIQKIIYAMVNPHCTLSE